MTATSPPRGLWLASLVLLLPAVARAAGPELPARGPYPVGFTQRTFTKPSVTTGAPRVLETLIWYPAVAGTGSAEGAILRDAEVAPQRHPLILFSHGSCGIPGQSPFYAETLASFGFVVAAPPHPGNTTGDFPQCSANAPDSFVNRVPDLQWVLTAMLLESGNPASAFWRRIHPKRIGATGHSFGGQTTLRLLAADRRVKAGVALAPALVPDETIRQPAMVIAGEGDTVTPFVTAARGSYERLDGRRWLVGLAGGDHCTFTFGCVPQLCGVCGSLPRDEGYAATVRWAVPFFLRWVAGSPRYGALLRPELATPPVTVEMAPPRRNP